jgi:hypothetical protein
LLADGPTEHMHNHVETTYRNNAPISNGTTYQISFRAKWLNGCSKLNTRLYFNRVAKTTLLEVPSRFGTPGAPNSVSQPNIGPAFAEFIHRPAVPKAADSVQVSVRVSDPDGVKSCKLWSGVNGVGWSSNLMTGNQGLFTGTLPPKPLGTVVQFYVEAEDNRGAVSFYPANGAGSRALYRVFDNQRLSTRTHNLRLIMLPSEAASMHASTNVMSNGRNLCTLIYDEHEIFYNCGIHLQASERGRDEVGRVGFTISFPADHLFRGVQDSITLDRSGGWSGHGGKQDEIVMRHIINQAGDLPDMYNDLASLIAPNSTYSGTAMLLMAKYGPNYLDGTTLPKDGSQFKIELIYSPTTSVNNDPQQPKLPQPDDVTGQDFHNMGNDPESYRWFFLAENKAWRSDYSQLIELAQTFSLSGTLLQAQTSQLMDMDEWTRVFAVKALSGDVDTYGFGYPHNQLFYLSPGHKALTFPWDMDFSWSRNPTDSINTGSNIGNIINSIPAYRRLYLGHISDILDRSYNTGYMARWTAHYGALAQQDYSGILTYIGQRAASARSQLPAPALFRITSNGGQNFTTNSPSILLAGTAPYTMKRLELRGAVSSGFTWTSESNWTTRLALTNGPNTIEVLGFDFHDQPISTNSLVIEYNVPIVDSDGDRMPNDWELLYGLNPFVQDAAGDLDSDGFSNLSEYLAGTNPADSGDQLRLGVAVASANQINLQFTAKPDHAYRLQYRTSLSLPWQNLLTVTAQSAEREISQSQTINALAPAVFYRLILSPIP